MLHIIESSSQNKGSSYLLKTAPSSILFKTTFFSCVDKYPGIFSKTADTFELYLLAALLISSLYKDNISLLTMSAL